MSAIQLRLEDWLSDIADAFNGKFHVKNSDFNKLKRQYNKKDIPTYLDDKRALRQDFNNVLTDSNKAIEKAKEKVYG